MSEIAPVGLHAADAHASAAIIPSLHARIAALQRSHEALMRAVAHDLRAPLRHINSLAPLLQQAVEELASHSSADSAAAAEVIECATMMQSAAQRMAQMLEGLAQVSRAARAPLNWAAVDWVALCHSTADRLRQAWPPIALRWDNAEHAVPQSGTVLLAADREWLGQLVAALFDNACKFSAGPRARAEGASQPLPQPLLVTLGARLLDGPVPELAETQPLSQVEAAHIHPGQHWQLSIVDAGVGFDLSRAQNLFAPFVRMHRDSDYAGVGCGLALAQTIAQRHGAQLHIQSAPNAGCTVRLLWPAAQVPATSA